MSDGRACRQWRQALWREVDGSLSAGESTRLRAHIDACDSCRKAHELAGRLDQALAAEPLAVPAKEFQDRVMLGLVAGVKGGKLRPGRPHRAQDPSGEAADWWVLLGGLGAALLVVVVSISVLSKLTLNAVSYAVASPSSAAAAFAEGLARGFQQGFAASGDSLAGLLQSPLSFGIVLMGGLLAVTLGWLGLTLSRSSA